MPIKIKSTSGSVTLDAQNVSGDQTLTVPSLAGGKTLLTTDGSGASLTSLPPPSAASVTEAMVHADAVNVFKSGRKNLVINGGFDVWQRGTSSTVTTNVETFTADRFAYYPSGGAATVTRQTFAVGQTDVPGNPKYYARVNTTTGDTWALYRQTIENPERFANKSITLSFWAKGTNPGGGKFQIYEDTYFNNVVSGTPTYTDLTVTGTWTKYSYTFNMPSHSGVTLSANDRWYFSWIQPAGDSSTAAWTLDVSQVQVEYGTTATDFEQRSYGEELALCQRYFVKQENGRLLNGYKRHDAATAFEFTLPVSMRTSPTAACSTYGIFTDMGSNYGSTQSGFSQYEYVESTAHIILNVQSTYSSTNVIIPSWEGMTFTLDAEL